MTEGTLKDAMVKKLRELLPGYVIIRHEDRFTAGIPDISITHNKRTSWWEVKFADPTFTSSGQQELTMLRLSTHGHAHYIVMDARQDRKRTWILTVEEFKTWPGEGSVREGFDYSWIAEEVKVLHS